MKIFYSGTSYTRDAIELPEKVLGHRKPGVMMSFWDLYQNQPGAMRRWLRHQDRLFYERKEGKQPQEPDMTLPDDDRG